MFNGSNWEAIKTFVEPSGESKVKATASLLVEDDEGEHPPYASTEDLGDASHQNEISFSLLQRLRQQHNPRSLAELRMQQARLRFLLGTRAVYRQWYNSGKLEPAALSALVQSSEEVLYLSSHMCFGRGSQSCCGFQPGLTPFNFVCLISFAVVLGRRCLP